MSYRDFSKECQKLLSSVVDQTRFKSRGDLTEIEVPEEAPDSLKVGYLIGQLRQRGFTVEVLPSDVGSKLLLRS